MIRVDAFDAQEHEKYLLELHPWAAPGVAACWISHARALEHFLASDATHALILEDDAIASTSARTAIDILQLQPADELPDFLQMGFLPGDWADQLNRAIAVARFRFWENLAGMLAHTQVGADLVNRRLRLREASWGPALARAGLRSVPADVRGGAHAFLVSRRFAELGIQMNRPLVFPADDLYEFLSRERVLNMRRLTRSLFDQIGVHDSDIGRLRFVFGRNFGR